MILIFLSTFSFQDTPIQQEEQEQLYEALYSHEDRAQNTRRVERSYVHLPPRRANPMDISPERLARMDPERLARIEHASRASSRLAEDAISQSRMEEKELNMKIAESYQNNFGQPQRARGQAFDELQPPMQDGGKPFSDPLLNGGQPYSDPLSNGAQSFPDLQEPLDAILPQAPLQPPQESIPEYKALTYQEWKKVSSFYGSSRSRAEGLKRFRWGYDSPNLGEVSRLVKSFD